MRLLIDLLTPEVLALQSGQPGWDIPHCVAIALGRLRDEHSVVVLIELLKNTRVSVRQAAARALGKIGDVRGAEALLNCLEDDEVVVRNAAVRALGKLGDNRAVEPLIVRLGTGWVADEVLIAVLRRLDRHWHRRARTRIDELAQTVAEGNEPQRAWAAEALSHIGGDVARIALLQALRRRDLKVVGAAHRYYIQEDMRDAVPVLIQALDRYGDETLMDGLLNSGHPALVKAARVWAWAHGMALVSWPLEETNHY